VHRAHPDVPVSFPVRRAYLHDIARTTVITRKSLVIDSCYILRLIKQLL